MTRRPALIPRDPLADAPDLDQQQRRLERLRQIAAEHGAVRADAPRNSNGGSPARARARRTSAGLSQRNYDLPQQLADTVAEIADRLKCPMSSVVAWLILRGLDSSTLDDLRATLTPARSPRFEAVWRASPETIESAKKAFFGACPPHRGKG